MKNNILLTYDVPSHDNTALYGNSLPEDSFVSYPAFKVKNAQIAWMNKSWLEEHSIDMEQAEPIFLDNFAYVSRGYADDAELDLTDSRIFLADRYGNTGDAGNGGSARCGLNGLLQIKGNGVNPLVAVNVDEGHSSGKLPLSEAISEAIWSELCHQELPYGALRIIAVIRTPQMITGDNTFGDEVEQPCSIMIREVATRPAHFEPALNFWPRQDYVRLRDATHKYVQSAVKLLESNERKQSGSNTPVYDVVERFVTRFATQVAVSRIKGIPHGSLTSSNIALDGRFLDLGTVSGIGDFSNVLLTSGLGATWDDHLGINEWLETFFYHLNKHSESGLNGEQQKALLDKFNLTLEEQENRYTAIECGIPEQTPELIEIGMKIKQELRKDKWHVSRLADCDFNQERFAAEVQSALKLVGYPEAKPKFKYRHIKYSRFTIFADPCLQGHCGSRKEISDFISLYLS
ncbi:MchC protein [Photobacterium lipolyticum]|uniref:MchC protein n=1 Tax=Photobacterium lipolyticum TaxID=266810 RepID=UPI001FE3697C|nr:MchC protein [Photobacterium lipolyticum]